MNQEATPFIETLEATDAGAIPDGSYAMQLCRVEKVVGTKYQSDELQDKLRFAFTVMQGEQQGSEVWRFENLPNAANGVRRVGKKAGVRAFVGMLRGKELADNESIQPASLIGTTGWGQIVGGKLKSYMPAAIQQSVAPQYSEPVSDASQAAAAQTPQQTKEVF